MEPLLSLLPLVVWLIVALAFAPYVGSKLLA